jgi:hypothetical protein
MGKRGKQVHKKHVLFLTEGWLRNRGWSLIPLMAILLCWILMVCIGCGSNGSSTDESTDNKTIVVNSIEDMENPPSGTVTLRAAIERIESGGTITFASALNGKTIRLSIVGSSHSILKGEFYKNFSEYLGFQERDYGKSALYARKNVIIDASSLPDGITVSWTGGDSNKARVLAVYGDLTMKNVTITSGYASYEAITDETQPYTLGRGGGLAVWGTATLKNCTISGNKAEGDLDPGRDRGSLGGGIYANRIIMEDCIVSGNRVTGKGAAGGGIYSVGGADGLGPSMITGCTVSGNRVTGQNTYGGGVFSEGGGRGNNRLLELKNCTIARNLVEDNPDIDEPAGSQYYYRGGGVYMSNGSLSVAGCTIVQNAVTGHPAIFNNKPNMAGGGIAATVGDAHVVEYMEVWHSIIAGNTLNGAPDDLSTGSLLNFYSYGYNLIGKIDFSQILVPIPPWWSLSRKHWPKVGDLDGIEVSEVLSLDNIEYHSLIKSVGTDEGQNVVLWYPPSGRAVDQIPSDAYDYEVNYAIAEYEVLPEKTDDFLNHVLEKLRNDYGSILGTDFGKDFGDMTGVTFYGPGETWPTNPENADWIHFWRDLDDEIGDRLGTVKLGDDFWGSFVSGPLGENIIINVQTHSEWISPFDSDQLGNPRPSGGKGDIGAIEK